MLSRDLTKLYSLIATVISPFLAVKSMQLRNLPSFNHVELIDKYSSYIQLLPQQTTTCTIDDGLWRSKYEYSGLGILKRGSTQVNDRHLGYQLPAFVDGILYQSDQRHYYKKLSHDLQKHITWNQVFYTPSTSNFTNHTFILPKQVMLLQLLQAYCAKGTAVVRHKLWKPK